MPILDEDLAAPGNEHLVVNGRATLRQAMALLTSPPVSGSATWHLVAARSNGSWAAARFAPLYTAASRDKNRLDTRLDDLDWLAAAPAIERDSMGIGEAEDYARDTPGELLVVTDRGTFAGILSFRRERGADTLSTSALVELAGEPADLTEFSDLLIKTSPPRPAARTNDE